jgi:hypothetical protein
LLVLWNEDAAATPQRELVFLPHLLAATRALERSVSRCPLPYRSGNAPAGHNVPVTLMLGLRTGHQRWLGVPPGCASKSTCNA